jgi:pyridoxamine 5'-phosphate oxidase
VGPRNLRRSHIIPSVQKDPFVQFADWFRQASRSKSIEDATAFCLSTIDPNGAPNGRMVLLKGYDARGFVFYTNLRSMKGESLRKIPQAALTFHWAPLKKQVRIQGSTQIVSDREADAYWKTRPRLTQLGAWASKQSEVLSNRAILLKAVAKLAIQFGTGPVPRPPFWTGVRIIPRKIEFWQGRASRLHDRFLYTKKRHGVWALARLYP